MKKAEIKTAFLQEIHRIAPDINADSVSDGDHLQEDLELDSMDILNLVAALDVRFGVSIAEQDYTRIATPELAVEFLSSILND